MLPKFSMAASCLTMTFFRAIRTAPLASVTETIMGSSSGVSPTASATAKRKDSSRSRRSSALTRKTKSTRKITTWRMRKPKRRVPRSNSVSGGAPDQGGGDAAELGRRAGRATTRAVAEAAHHRGPAEHGVDRAAESSAPPPAPRASRAAATHR